MQDFERGTARANQLTFEYLTQGDGPLALCIHGFPDSPYSYRYLLPALAEAGYRAVAPFNRGFAPTELPADRHHIHSSMMVADQIALHEALSGDSDAVLIAHDWGAVGAWGRQARNRAGSAAALCSISRLIEESVPGVTVWIVASRGPGRPGSHIRCRPVMAWLPNDVPACRDLAAAWLVRGATPDRSGIRHARRGPTWRKAEGKE